ncbi:MAG: hypothetical protein QNJ97_15475 [Myxococcota bacterium]|nr:hypothetical protein [Myxococcota bacterium]
MSNESGFQGTVENLEKIKPQLDALRPEEVRQFNLSVPNAVSAAMRVFKAFKADVSAFVRTFRFDAFDPADYENFPERVGALWYVNKQLNQAIDPKGDADAILAKIGPLHAKLGKAAVYLWCDSEELGPVVADIRAGAGRMDKADELVRYAALFEEHWAEAKDNSNVTQDDLTAARTLSAQLIDTLTAIPPSDLAELRDIQNRAGEYLRRAVDDIRAAAIYIFRRDPEALERYPSLYANVSQSTPRKSTIVRPDATAPTETD